jgi:DNA-binding NtrC family response regulator
MQKPRLFLIEDDESALFGYQRYLNNAGYVTETATSLADARQGIEGAPFDAILLDLRLPDGNALEWIPQLKERHPSVPVIVISGLNDIPTAVKATKYGAENFLTKPIDMEELATTLEKTMEIRSLRKQQRVQQRLDKREPPYFGSSTAILDLLNYANVAAANDTVVLLHGETGTGKGMLARWIHDHSPRCNEAFVELNCSALKGELLRSELFGHAKGSFTSAIKDREGLVEVADNGTLFLDEIGDMDVDVQAQLLKTIEERSYRRIGENKVRQSDFRLLCATNRDLVKATENGTFRIDLYYRICVFPITVPALRERRSDIQGLAEHILAGFGYPYLPLSPEVVDVLTTYAWPGNVRELRNMLERGILLSARQPLQPMYFPGMKEGVAHQVERNSDETCDLEEIERRHIARILREFNGDKNRASKALGISLSSLYRRLAKL